MSDQEVLLKINGHREKIDALDEKIVSLLNERATQSLAIRELKPEANMGLFDPKREEEIFTHLASVNNGPMFDDDVRTIYETILKVMKGLQS